MNRSVLAHGSMCGTNLAYTPYIDRVHHMLTILESRGEWQEPDPQFPGELWLRWGLDGFQMWNAHFVSLVVGPAAMLHTLPMQSPAVTCATLM